MRMTKNCTEHLGAEQCGAKSESPKLRAGRREECSGLGGDGQGMKDIAACVITTTTPTADSARGVDASGRWLL